MIDGSEDESIALEPTTTGRDRMSNVPKRSTGTHLSVQGTLGRHLVSRAGPNNTLLTQTIFVGVCNSDRKEKKRVSTTFECIKFRAIVRMIRDA
jgi:hypothetical protein